MSLGLARHHFPPPPPPAVQIPQPLGGTWRTRLLPRETEEAVPIFFPRKTLRRTHHHPGASLPPPPLSSSPSLLHQQILRDTYCTYCGRPVLSLTQKNRHGPAFNSLIRFRWEGMKQWVESGIYIPQCPTVCHQLIGLEKFKE